MSYWAEDAAYLRDIAARESTYFSRRLKEIARDMERTTPDGEFLEDLANKIEGWVEARVLPTPDFAEEIGQSLRDISLLLKKHPEA